MPEPARLPHAGQRVAIIYDSTLRPDTTGEYCRRALEELGAAVTHYGPAELEAIPPIYTLYLRVDDDLEYEVPERLRPLAYWAIDTHRDFAGRLERARRADAVFCAQRDGAARLRSEGLVRASWLPLACDPAVHRRLPGIEKRYDVCFVGNTFPGDGERSRLVEWIRQSYPTAFVGRAYGEEMARIYTASRLIFNCAIRNDINMRVFEAAACGSLVVTSDLAENGQERLFTSGSHLVTYREADELPLLIGRYLDDENAREAIAEAGMQHAHGQHSYRRRMRELLAAVAEGRTLDDRYPLAEEPAGEARGGGGGAAACGPGRRPGAETTGEPVAAPPTAGGPGRTAHRLCGQPHVSIVIPAWNGLEMTRACVAALRQHTDRPYEMLLVDNGSEDGTADWGVREGLRVLRNAVNLGFPAACNQGLLAATGDHCVLLNNDALVSPGWLGRLLAHAEREPQVGLVGPSTNLACSLQQVPVSYQAGEQFLAFAEQLAREQAGRADEVRRLVGLCLLIPRRVLQAVGLLDPRFGLGLFEDDDYCLRVRQAGYRLLWARDVFVHHEGHQTFRRMPEAEYRRRLAENEERFRAKWRVEPLLASWEEETALVTRLQSGQVDAWDLLRAGRYGEAYDAFERSAGSGAGDPQALLGLGLAAEGRGIPAAAALAYEAILGMAPGQPDAVRGLARVRPEAPRTGGGGREAVGARGGSPR